MRKRFYGDDRIVHTHASPIPPSPRKSTRGNPRSFPPAGVEKPMDENDEINPLGFLKIENSQYKDKDKDKYKDEDKEKDKECGC